MHNSNFSSGVLFVVLAMVATTATAQTAAISNAFDADELEAVTSGTGVCKNPSDINKAPHDADGRIGRGNWRLDVEKTSKFDIELVGAGGSGGGATLGNKHPFWGGGGGSGEIKHWLGYSFDKGIYVLQVGAGGQAVSGSKNYHDYRVRPVNGIAGGETAIIRCKSGFRVLAVKGGSGGSGDAYDIGPVRPQQRGGNGADLIDPENKNAIGRGGPGGSWQHKAPAARGTGFGSGGGGEGGHTGPGTQSGRGADGFARLVKVG